MFCWWWDGGFGFGVEGRDGYGKCDVRCFDDYE